jgi:hypothetical protein
MNHPYFPANGRRPLRRTSQLLPLEQRFMFDGAVADAAHAAQAHDSAPPPVPPAVTVRAAEPARDEGKKEVVLVDTSLANHKSLEAGVRAGVGIVEFDGSRDGLAQIAQWAASQSGLDAIHILSHGSEGKVNLGSAQLTEAALSSSTTQAELAQLGRALTTDGDLLLYGCDVAAGDGAHLLAGIAKATGADVAASRDATGAADKGGNWTLEAHEGKIDTKALEISDYQDLLTQITFSDGDADYSSTTIVKQVNSRNITFLGGAGVGGLGMDGSYGALGLYAYEGPTNQIKLTISIEAGYTFDISSLDVGVQSNSLTIALTYADNTTASFVINSLNNFWQTLSSFSTPINDVKQVVFSSSDFGLFQNFDITDVKAIPVPPVAVVATAALSADTGTSGSDFITKTAAQTISGTLSANLASGERVEVSYNNGATWSNATTYTVGLNTWSTTTTLSGTSTFQARVANSGASSTAYTHSYTLDTVAPTTTFSGYALSADTGTSASDFITKTSAQTITATLSGAPAGSDIVWGSVDNGSTWTNITNKVSGTTLTWNGAVLVGGGTIVFKVTDLAGNDSGLSTRNYTLDTTAPTTSVATAALSNDSGTSSSDFITNTAAQTISGTLSANLISGETVFVSLDNGSTWLAATAVVGTHTWSLAGQTLTASNTLKVKVSDTAGNDGTVAQQAYVLDTTAPTISFSAVALSADTGTSNTDFITNTAAQTISATLSGALAGSDILYGSLDNGATWTDITSKVSGTTLTWNGVTLAGSNTLKFKVTDAAGNDGAAHSQAYVLDTIAPTTSFSSLALSADTGASASDFITKTSAQTITATLSGAPAGTDIVWGSLDGGSTWTNITNKVSGTTLSWNGAVLNAGSNSIVFKVTDAAGNDSSLSLQNYTLDTTAPTTSVATAAFSNDSGTSSSDFITNTAAQTISGTLSANVASGETVYVSLDNGSTWIAATAVVGTNTWSLAGQTLTASNTLKVKVSDTAGNDGAILSQAYVLDTAAPTISFSAVALSADTGASNTDFITNTAAQTISATLSGALAGGDILYGSLDNGDTWINITSKVSGTTLTWNGVTLAGSDTLKLRVTDAAGNDGTAHSQAYVLDTSGPSTPGTPVLDSASDSGASNGDGITSDTTPTFTGSADIGSIVSIYDGATLLGTAVAGAGGWSFTSGVLGSGSHLITAVASDTAGNTSAASGALSITIDTVAPAATSVAVPASGTYYTGQPLDFTVNFDEAVTVDTGDGTPRIALVVGATTHYADYVSGSGSGALVFRYVVVNGDADSNGITVGALSLNGGSLKDTAGNNATVTLNSVGSTAGVDVDGSLASVTSVSASTANGSYGAGQTITITVDFSGAVTVDISGGTPTLALASGGSATYSSGSGSSTLSFTYTVAAGENSADLDYSSAAALALNGATIVETGGAHQAALVTLAAPGEAGSLGANKDIVIDTTAPTTTVVSAAFSADSGTSASDFITNIAAQTVSGTLSANVASGESVYISLDNGATWTLASTTVGANTWSLAEQTLTGSGTLKVKVSDAAGNDGAVYSQAYVLDNTAPEISFSGLALSADTGTAGDFITNTAAQTISATLSAAPAGGDKVYGSLDNGDTWIDITSMVSGSTLTWTGVTLAASNTLQLKVTDAAGNDGAATTQAYTLDTTGPATSVASALFSADSGSSATDLITRTAAQTVSGTLSANLAAGETVYVSLNNGETWQAASGSVGSAAWSLAGQTLTGSSTLLVKVSDNAGNDGTVYARAYVFDTTAPAAPTVTPLTTDSLAPTLGGNATLAAGDSMTVTVGGATYYVTPVDGAWSLDLSTAELASGTLTLVLNNQYSVVATITDAAGNSVNDSSSGELIVGNITPPPTTAVNGAVLSNDSGISNSDFITNVAQQTISGTLSAPLLEGESLLVSIDGGDTWQTADASGSSWSLAGVTLAGSNTLLIKVNNAGGDGPVYSHSYTVDTSLPIAPTVNTQAALTLTPVLSGTATLGAGETLSVTVGGASYDVAVVEGKWTLNLASATPSSGVLALAAGGHYEVVATATDLAGNTRSDSSSGELQIAAAPATAITGVALSGDSGSSTADFITNVAAQTISGTLSAPLAAGQTVEVSFDGGATWHSTGAAAGSAAWSVGATLSGSNVFMARVSSDSGKGPVFQHAYTLDTVAPLASPTSASLSGANVLSGGLSAPLGEGESVLVSRDGGVNWLQASVSGDSWSLAGVVAGTVQVQVRDAAGNTGSILRVEAITQLVPPVVPEVPLVPLKPAYEPPVVADARPAATLPQAPVSPLSAPVLQSLTNTATLLTAFTPNDTAELSRGYDGLVAYRPIADLNIRAGERISVQLPPDTFVTSGNPRVVELSAQSMDGKALPGWLKFDSRTARFEGTPPPGFEGTLSFKVMARDSRGHVAVQVFKIVVTKDGHAVKTSAIDGHVADPAGRSGLSEQMRSVRGAGADRLAALSRSAAVARGRA